MESKTRQIMAVDFDGIFHGLKFDAVNENLPEVIELMGGDSRKIFANEYIDDKNVLVDSLLIKRRSE